MDQVQSIAVVMTAIDQGDLTQKIEISIEGEMSTLKGTCLEWIMNYFQNCNL